MRKLPIRVQTFIAGVRNCIKIGSVYHLRRLGLIQYIKPFLFVFYRVQVPPVLIKGGIFYFYTLSLLIDFIKELHRFYNFITI